MKIRNFESFKKYIAQNNIKKCIIRCDFNVPSDIEDNTRIFAVKETVSSILELGIRIVLMSHYKRPTVEDVFNSKYSLKNIVPAISKILEEEVDFVKNSVFNIEPSSISSKITLLENLRFYEGETTNDVELAKRLATFGEVYVNDAFSVAHRSHASVCAITQFLPSFAGCSFSKEIENISKLTCDIKRPYAAIIGGSKISSKIDVLKSISKIADYLIITGSMANTFLASKGHDLKNSAVLKDQFELAQDILQNSKAEIVLPVDFFASNNINTDGKNYATKNIPNDCSCFDIGDASTSFILEIIKQSKTLLWNGAIGAFEFANFDRSSKKISKAIASQTLEGGLVSIIGGGETVASIPNELRQNMTFVSTAGGAFLQFVAGEELPGVNCLCDF